VAAIFGLSRVYSYMGPRTSEAQARFAALRTAYDDAFQKFSRQVLSLQSLLRHATPDREAILEARGRVEQAQSAYRESRDLLAQSILGRDVKPAHRNVDSSCQVERLAHQLWERAGRPLGRADEHWYRAEQLIQNTC
jgi:hypothetical protein